MVRFNAEVANRQSSPPRTYRCDVCAVRGISACASLNEHERRRLTSIMTTIVVAPHRHIFMEAAPARSLYNVTEGTVMIYKMMADGRRQVTGFLFPGDFLGLVNNDSYAYSAEAVTQTRLCQFPRRQFKSLLEELPRLEQR